MTPEMIGTQSIHPDYSNLHNILYILPYALVTLTSFALGPATQRRMPSAPL